MSLIGTGSPTSSQSTLMLKVIQESGRCRLHTWRPRLGHPCGCSIATAGEEVVMLGVAVMIRDKYAVRLAVESGSRRRLRRPSGRDWRPLATVPFRLRSGPWSRLGPVRNSGVGPPQTQAALGSGESEITVAGSQGPRSYRFSGRRKSGAGTWTAAAPRTQPWRLGRGGARRWAGRGHSITT